MENLNIFIRSIFVDNMIFAYFLGMCSFPCRQQECEDVVWPGSGSYVHVGHHIAYKLSS